MPPQNATILFVEDDDANRRLLSWIFRNEGFEVLEAASGAEALRLAAAKPDLVILDVSLPDLTGFEVCRRLKAEPSTASTPVLHVSAVYINSGDRSQGLESGADGYLIKPVEPREMLATVRALLRVHAAEEAARAASHQWRLTFDAISDPVCLVDAAGVVLRCNRAVCDLLDRPFPAVVGRPYALLMQEAFQLGEPPDLAFGAGEPGRHVNEVRLGRRWFAVTADPIRDERGAPAGGVSILTDVTRRRALEEQLRQVQKLEAIGRLAGGVAHDFNNLLTAVVGNAALLMQSLSTEAAEYELAAAIEQAAWRRRVDAAASRLLAANALVAAARQPQRLRRRGRRPAQADHRPPHRPRRRLRADVGPVQADPGQMNQVLMNLCINACDAMPEGGRLRIETSNQTVDEEHTRRAVEARAGSFVRLRAADTGSGIAPENLPRIFDPFFTTKQPGKGTGLGLAMVFGIVKQHEGWVECRSEPGRGACFDVYLPALPGTAAAAPAVAPSAALTAGRGEVVLLADDNELLRSLGATILRHHGYRVLLAEDGQEAVEAYRARGGPDRAGRPGHDHAAAVRPRGAAAAAEDQPPRPGAVRQRLQRRAAFGSRPRPHPGFHRQTVPRKGPGPGGAGGAHGAGVGAEQPRPRSRFTTAFSRRRLAHPVGRGGPVGLRQPFRVGRLDGERRGLVGRAPPAEQQHRRQQAGRQEGAPRGHGGAQAQVAPALSILFRCPNS